MKFIPKILLVALVSALSSQSMVAGDGAKKYKLKAYKTVGRDKKWTVVVKNKSAQEVSSSSFKKDTSGLAKDIVLELSNNPNDYNDIIVYKGENTSSPKLESRVRSQQVQGGKKEVRISQDKVEIVEPGLRPVILSAEVKKLDPSTHVVKWAVQTTDIPDTSNQDVTIISKTSLKKDTSGISGVSLQSNYPTYILVYKSPTASGKPVASVVTPNDIQRAGSNPVIVIDKEGVAIVTNEAGYQKLYKEKVGTLYPTREVTKKPEAMPTAVTPSIPQSVTPAAQPKPTLEQAPAPSIPAVPVVPTTVVAPVVQSDIPEAPPLPTIEKPSLQRAPSIPMAPPLPKQEASVPVAPPLTSTKSDIPVAPPLPTIEKPSVQRAPSIPVAPPLPSTKSDIPVAPPLPNAPSDIPVAPPLPTEIPTAPKTTSIVEQPSVSRPSLPKVSGEKGALLEEIRGAKQLKKPETTPAKPAANPTGFEAEVTKRRGAIAGEEEQEGGEGDDFGPADKPVEKPADKPVAKPTPQQPVAKPAPKPVVTKPTTESSRGDLLEQIRQGRKLKEVAKEVTPPTQEPRSAATTGGVSLPKVDLPDYLKQEAVEESDNGEWD